MKKNEMFINFMSIFGSLLIVLLNNVVDYNIKMTLLLFLFRFLLYNNSFCCKNERNKYFIF